MQTQNVQVVVRSRPLSIEERARGVHELVHCDGHTNEVKVAVSLGQTKGERVFAYDKVYGPKSSQRELYCETVEPIVQQTLKGYNTTVFAYGQTGTGKTHTMEGDVDDPEMCGVIPRAIASIFKALEERGDSESYVKASYLEIYNENLTDLLSPGVEINVPPSQQLRIVEDKTKVGRSVVVQNLEEVLVKSVGDIQKVMKQAMAKRKVASTDLNDKSSRSHAVFTVTVYLKETTNEGEEVVRVGKINLVDLAGSECVARSGSKDARAREAGNINQSLLTLGRVITALVEKCPHVPYRDSKLTRLLSESLGGCAMTLIIATVAPSVQCLDETLSTLEYASRAKSIKNRPQANQKMSKRTLIKEYVDEIERLRMELHAARAKDGVYMPLPEYEKLVSSNQSTSNRVTELDTVLEKRVSELNELKTWLSSTQVELKKTSFELESEKDRLFRAKEEIKRKDTIYEEMKSIAEERQAIVDAHVSTESKLLHIHDQLQDRLRGAKERVFELHEKIDRKHAIEGENENIVNDHRAQIDKALTSMSRVARDNRVVTLACLAKSQESLERAGNFFVSEHGVGIDNHRKRVVDAAIKCVGNASTLSNSWRVADETFMTKEVNTNVEAFAEIENAFRNARSTAVDAMELAKATSQVHVETLHRDCVTPCFDEIQRSKASIKSFTESWIQAEGAIRDAFRAMVEDYEKKLEHARLEREQFLQMEKARTTKMTKSMTEMLTRALTEFSDDTNNRLDSFSQDSRKREEENKTLVRIKLVEIAESADSIKASSQIWADGEMSSLSNCTTLVCENEAFAVKAARTAWEDVTEMSEETQQRASDGLSNAAAARERVSKSTEMWLKECAERCETEKEEFQNAQRTIGELDRVAEVEQRQMEKRGEEICQQTKNELHFGEKSIDDHSKQMHNELQGAQSVLGSFDLKRDRATGQTPSKSQRFDWPTDRPQTESHMVVVRKFRTGSVQPLSPLAEYVAVTMTAIKPPIEPILNVLKEKDTNVQAPIVPQTEDVDGLNVQQLRTALKEQGLNMAGTKQILKERLGRRMSGFPMLTGDAM